MSNPRQIPRPNSRKLRVFAADPSLEYSLDTALVNCVEVEIPWEEHPTEKGADGPAPGPIGEYLEVVDYDPASGCYYDPVDLNDPHLLAQNGYAPSDGNPQFHQQMVYAVAMKTIKNFEQALGRRILWAPRESRTDGKVKSTFVERLRVYPHAMREANAYYSPEKKALLFGYFSASRGGAKGFLPGGVVFTCLSHDIIAHELTHALLDGQHELFIQPTNPDVLAFHEAFADIVALFQHFSLKDILNHQIARTAGDLTTATLLSDLAVEFGQAMGNSRALRSAIKEAGPIELRESMLEPHDRGAVLMAAVFDAFLTIYGARTADLLRLASGGTGILAKGAIHPDLVNRLSTEASKAALHVLKMCLRALDYLPPVDITFGDYLRAIITSDADLVPDDDREYRVAFVESFRRHGIYPEGVRSFSQHSLTWEGPAKAEADSETYLSFVRGLYDLVRGWDLDSDRRALFLQMERSHDMVEGIIKETYDCRQRVLKGVDLERDFEVHSIRPVRRIGPSGQLLVDLLFEITQKEPGYLKGDLGDARAAGKEKPADFFFLGGCTVLADMRTGQMRYCISKDVNDEARYKRQQEFVSSSGSLRATYLGALHTRPKDVLFACLHRPSEERVI